MWADIESTVRILQKLFRCEVRDSLETVISNKLTAIAEQLMADVEI